MSRHCGSPLQHTVIDLGHQPPSNAYLRPEQLAQPEITYPLQVFVCTSYWLMQLPTHATAEELFTPDYAQGCFKVPDAGRKVPHSRSDRYATALLGAPAANGTRFCCPVAGKV